MKTAINATVQALQDFLENNFGDPSYIPETDLRSNISIDSRYADIAIPCQGIASLLDTKEEEMAEWIHGEFAIDPEIIESVSRQKAFLNFKLNRSKLVERVLTEIGEQRDSYGSNTMGEGKTVVVDYSAPNIGKPLHIGHIRSTILGDSVMRIFRKAGYNTHGINYLGDIGLHLGKVIVCYQKFLDKDAFREDPEKELARLYVKFGEKHEEYCKAHMQEREDSENPDDEDLEQVNSPWMHEAKEILQKLEAGDPHMNALLEEIHNASMRGFSKVYDLLEVEFDEITGQRRFSEKGKQVVEQALEMGVAEHNEDGAVVVTALQDHGLPCKVILRSDGTAIYSTQDLGAAYSRYEEFGFDKLVYAVAEEQDMYFKQIFKIFELMGNDWARDCHHLSFGMIQLSDAKMSSRKGNIVYLADVLNQAVERAKDLVDDEIPDEERDRIAHMVGIGAVKYMVLGVDPIRNMKFSWDKALSLNANSSPYIQYSYVRANSVMNGATPGGFDPEHLTSPETFGLAKKLGCFPIVVERAATSMKPNIVANYANDLARTFTRFYHAHKIRGTPEEESRLFLTDCYRIVVKDSLDLLGIKMPEKM